MNHFIQNGANVECLEFVLHALKICSFIKSITLSSLRWNCLFIVIVIVCAVFTIVSFAISHRCYFTMDADFLSLNVLLFVANGFLINIREQRFIHQDENQNKACEKEQSDKMRHNMKICLRVLKTFHWIWVWANFQFNL